MKIEKLNIPFTQIPNLIADIPELSWKAKGIFLHIQSKPRNWDFKIERMSKCASDGRDSTASGVQELEEKGFLIRKKTPSGKMKYKLDIPQKYKEDLKKYLLEDLENTEKEEKKPKTENPLQGAKKPVTENPCHGKSLTGKTRHISNTYYSVILNKEVILNNIINLILEIFNKFNPSVGYSNKTERNAVEWAIEEFGNEVALKMIEYALQIQGREFAPTITKPTEFKRNYGKLKNYYNKHSTIRPNGIKI